MTVPSNWGTNPYRSQPRTQFLITQSLPVYVTLDLHSHSSIVTQIQSLFFSSA
nr:hypothetical protein Iba_chr11eCG14130 [Ipomoea batatas]